MKIKKVSADEELKRKEAQSVAKAVLEKAIASFGSKSAPKEGVRRSPRLQERAAVT